jgi:hypothetical protein
MNCHVITTRAAYKVLISYPFYIIKAHPPTTALVLSGTCVDIYGAFYVYMGVSNEREYSTAVGEHTPFSSTYILV